MSFRMNRRDVPDAVVVVIFVVENDVVTEWGECVCVCWARARWQFFVVRIAGNRLFVVRVIPIRGSTMIHNVS